MTSEITTPTVQKVRPFVFESYGVIVRIDGNIQEMVDHAETVARASLLNVRDLSIRTKAEQRFEVRRSKTRYSLYLNGEGIGSCRGRKKFLKFFDAIIRITVGEHSPEKVFMHAGAVGWKGKGIIIPAQSFQGKSTLVSELVRLGAEYYSDDFAIFDGKGLLHPFPRTIGMRSKDQNGYYTPYELSLDDIGGVAATVALPVGLVLLTRYESGAKWEPETLTAGQGLLEMIPFTLPLRKDPEFSMRVLKSIATRAIIVRSPRGAAEEFAKLLLNFVDKHVN